MEAVQSWQKEFEVFLSMLKGGNATAIGNEKQFLSSLFTTLAEIVRFYAVDSKVEHKLQDSIRKYNALCEHQWGEMYC